MNNSRVARRDQSGRLYGTPLAQPSSQASARIRARWSRAARVLLALGIITNILVLMPGFAAAAMMNAYTPAMVTMVISAVAWTVTVLAWKVLMQRVTARPAQIHRSAAEHGARQEAIRGTGNSRSVRTSVDGDLEFPE
ncbi:hypothetical protein [Streptomyces sp. MMS24-I29]|uniref:hypothetical protein n=1 Tax=Streptomyces sp. MMS24-I29 TaxID=3351480 RepID=UPI003C7B01F9